VKFRFFHHRLKELDARVEDAQRRAEQATQEAEISMQRKKNVEEKVVEPLRRQGAHNQFAELLRASLITGHHNGNIP
jgi:hypothetical protein